MDKELTNADHLVPKIEWTLASADQVIANDIQAPRNIDVKRAPGFAVVTDAEIANPAGDGNYNNSYQSMPLS